MEIVVMDVHHINVMVRRENGTVASPKFLAFHDVATNRVFGELVFFNERGGVRNVDVIEAFKCMCQHPAFGMPQKLYCDNGSEYGFADYLEDALKLNCSITPYTAEDRARVIRAKPYNASAKVVEGFFRQMNQQYFRHIPGCAGTVGDRPRISFGGEMFDLETCETCGRLVCPGETIAIPVETCESLKTAASQAHSAKTFPCIARGLDLRLPAIRPLPSLFLDAR